VPHSHTSLFYHIVFSTKERHPFLNLDVRARVFDYLGGTIRSEDGTSLIVMAWLIMFIFWLAFGRTRLFRTFFETSRRIHLDGFTIISRGCPSLPGKQDMRPLRSASLSLELFNAILQTRKRITKRSPSKKN